MVRRVYEMSRHADQLQGTREYVVILIEFVIDDKNPTSRCRKFSFIWAIIGMLLFLKDLYSEAHD